MSSPFTAITDYYNRLVGQYGHDPRACDYGRPESQAAKFRVLAEATDYSGRSVLDVGCGFADFADALRERFPDVRYHGVDLSPAMIDRARALRPHLDLRVANVLDLPGDAQHDVVTANGVFYLLGGEAPSLMQAIVSRMFSLAKSVVAFNSLSAWASDREAGEFYADPTATLAFCRTLSPRVVLRHDYHPRDFTLYLYKGGRAMIVSINQPAYLPWLGYFHRIAVSDLHIVLDHVQFEKNGYGNRNKVRTKDGWCWLTVPLKTKGKFGELYLNQIEIADNREWAVKHEAALAQNYGRAPYYAEHAPALMDWYGRPWRRLGELARATTRYQLDALGIRTPLLFSSEMGATGAKDELVLNLCRAVGATTYLSGPLGRNYIREGPFAAAGVRLAYHDYVHPTYPQRYPGFEPYMAALDLLLNRGPDSLAVIRQGNDAFEAAQIGRSPRNEGKVA